MTRSTPQDEYYYKTLIVPEITEIKEKLENFHKTHIDYKE